MTRLVTHDGWGGGSMTRLVTEPGERVLSLFGGSAEPAFERNNSGDAYRFGRCAPYPTLSNHNWTASTNASLMFPFFIPFS